jgi:hypothetical protein
VWLRATGTPAALLYEVRKAGQSCWLGYCSTPTRKEVSRVVEGILSSREKTRATAPYGLKLLALSRPFLAFSFADYTLREAVATSVWVYVRTVLPVPVWRYRGRRQLTAPDAINLTLTLQADISPTACRTRLATVFSFADYTLKEAHATSVWVYVRTVLSVPRPAPAHSTGCYHLDADLDYVGWRNQDLLRACRHALSPCVCLLCV